jgi:hypothetical protein
MERATERGDRVDELEWNGVARIEQKRVLRSNASQSAGQFWPAGGGLDSQFVNG